MIEKPKQLISIEKAKELSNNFTQEVTLQRNSLQRSSFQGKPAVNNDANAVWYSIETLENYIAYIKQEAENKGYDLDGIRFYFGKYSNSEKDGKAGHTTLFLTPTGQRREAFAKGIQNVNKISNDITEISAMNYGGLGNPPKMEYGEQQ
jgi:hypothetical protein